MVINKQEGIIIVGIERKEVSIVVIITIINTVKAYY